MFARRRPLLRAAVVGGGAYVAGKHMARASDQRAADEAYQDDRISALEQQQQGGYQQQQQGYQDPQQGYGAPPPQAAGALLTGQFFLASSAAANSSSLSTPCWCSVAICCS